jgi:hypothetical protein
MATEETPMEFIVWVETRLPGKTLAVQEVAKFIVALVESHPRRYALQGHAARQPYRRTAEMVGELLPISDWTPYSASGIQDFACHRRR